MRLCSTHGQLEPERNFPASMIVENIYIPLSPETGGLSPFTSITSIKTPAPLEHHLIEQAGSARLRDEVRFTMRWGALGIAAGRMLLVPHIRAWLNELSAEARA